MLHAAALSLRLAMKALQKALGKMPSSAGAEKAIAAAAAAVGEDRRQEKIVPDSEDEESSESSSDEDVAGGGSLLKGLLSLGKGSKPPKDKKRKGKKSEKKSKTKASPRRGKQKRDGTHGQDGVKKTEVSETGPAAWWFTVLGTHTAARCVVMEGDCGPLGKLAACCGGSLCVLRLRPSLGRPRSKAHCGGQGLRGPIEHHAELH